MKLLVQPRNLIWVFQKTSLEEDRLTFIQNKIAYRQLSRRQCKKKHKENLAKRLYSTISEPKAFWRELRTNLGFSQSRGIENIN